jgi:hypothetical protein
MLSFEPVTLDGNYGDEEAVLVFRDGHLLAIAARLGGGHAELAGHWYVEKTFGNLADAGPETFIDQGALQDWFSSRLRS